MSRIPDAISCYEKYLQKKNDDYETQFLLGNLYISQKEFAKATIAFTKLLENESVKDEAAQILRVIEECAGKEIGM